MTVPWKEGHQQISREEYDLRWDFGTGKVRMSTEEFKRKIKEIRERTGKP